VETALDSLAEASPKEPEKMKRLATKAKKLFSKPQANSHQKKTPTSISIQASYPDLRLDQYVLDFGSRGQLASLHQKKQQIVHIRNVGCHKAQFHIKPLFGTSDKDRFNWTLKVEPKEGILKKGQSVPVTFELEIFKRAAF
jgi:hypothetical protein